MAVGPVISNAEYYGHVGGYFSAGASARPKGKETQSATPSAEEKAATEKDSKTSEAKDSEKSGSKSASKAKATELTPEELKQVAELKATDQRVRAHEQAHVAAGGQYIRGGANFQYQSGPDGKRYAVGGEVSIDTSPEKEPAATIGKMQVVRRAALAPADPSAQDRSVAATATQRELEARVELSQLQREELAAKSEKTSSDSDDEPKRGRDDETNPRGRNPYGQDLAASTVDLYA